MRFKKPTRIRSDPAIDFSRYQSFIVFHAGVGKDVDLGFDETPQDVPSLFITSNFLQTNLGISSISVDNGAVQVSNGMLLPETESQVGIGLGLNGILVANFASQLGLLDLFSPETQRSGIGRFGLMDAGLFNGDGLLPALPSAWTRIDAGWETPLDIYYSPGDELTVHSTLSSHPQRIYRIPINKKEYFLVENRYAGRLNLDSLRFEMSQGLDTLVSVKEVLITHFPDQVSFSERGVLVDVKNPDIGLPGSGCLIWHIDENVIDANRAANRINADPDHRGVDLEEADGSQDIGQEFDFLSAGAGSETGWILDMWYQGNSAPLFKQDDNEFSVNTVPNSRSYNNRANSHVTISNFSRPDSVMTFRVNLNIFQQNFPPSVDPVVYGKVTAIKTTDLDFNGFHDLILTTTTGKVLAVGSEGNNSWATDSLEVLDLDDDLIPPPALFTIPSQQSEPQKGMVALTQSGKVYGFVFTQQKTVDTLFKPYQLNSPNTTHPLAFIDSQSGSKIIWGNQNGNVYQLTIDENTVSLDSLFNVGEGIRFVHRDGENNIIVTSSNGKIFQNHDIIKQDVSADFGPVGDESVIYDRNNQLYALTLSDELFQQQFDYQLKSPLIAIPFVDNIKSPWYFAGGQNRLFSFRYNFALTENYPVKIFQPDRKANLILSPLFGKFFRGDNSEDFGVLISDPAGSINGYDLRGELFVDFPLVTGDSLKVSPVLLDIDGDADAEVAAVTNGGQLYVWDLNSTFEENGWNQLFADEMNTNRIVSTAGIDLPVDSKISSNQLLPEEKVYNWPNPNTENHTFIRYYLTDNATVSLKIFDIAGDLVRELEAPGNPQTFNEVRWNLSNIQSGVYLARVEAKSSSASEVRIIKIAVVK